MSDYDPWRWHEDQARNDLGEPSSWRFEAYKLSLAASILYNEVNKNLLPPTLHPKNPHHILVSDQANLLQGYAIECLLKGIIISNNGLSESKNLITGRNGHSLIKLTQLAEVEVSKLETYLLKHVEAIIKWAGRYPGPLGKTNTLNSPPVITDLETGGKNKRFGKYF